MKILIAVLYLLVGILFFVVGIGGGRLESRMTYQRGLVPPTGRSCKYYDPMITSIIICDTIKARGYCIISEK